MCSLSAALLFTDKGVPEGCLLPGDWAFEAHKQGDQEPELQVTTAAEQGRKEVVHVEPGFVRLAKRLWAMRSRRAPRRCHQYAEKRAPKWQTT